MQGYTHGVDELDVIEHLKKVPQEEIRAAPGRVTVQLLKEF